MLFPGTGRGQGDRGQGQGLGSGGDGAGGQGEALCNPLSYLLPCLPRTFEREAENFKHCCRGVTFSLSLLKKRHPRLSGLFWRSLPISGGAGAGRLRPSFPLSIIMESAQLHLLPTIASTHLHPPPIHSLPFPTSDSELRLQAISGCLLGGRRQSDSYQNRRQGERSPSPCHLPLPLCHMGRDREGGPLLWRTTLLALHTLPAVSIFLLLCIFLSLPSCLKKKTHSPLTSAMGRQEEQKISSHMHAHTARTLPHTLVGGCSHTPGEERWRWEDLPLTGTF